MPKGEMKIKTTERWHFYRVSSATVIVYPERCPVTGLDSICVTAGCFQRMSSIATIILLDGRLQRKEEKQRLLRIWASVSALWQLVRLPITAPVGLSVVDKALRAVTYHYNAPNRFPNLISSKIHHNHWNSSHCFFHFFFFLFVLPGCLVLLWLFLFFLFLTFLSTH